MSSDNKKEVYFHLYCGTCKHKKTPDWAEPCCYCLDEPARVDSHKPVKWEEHHENV